MQHSKIFCYQWHRRLIWHHDISSQSFPCLIGDAKGRNPTTQIRGTTPSSHVVNNFPQKVEILCRIGSIKCLYESRNHREKQMIPRGCLNSVFLQSLQSHKDLFPT